MKLIACCLLVLLATGGWAQRAFLRAGDEIVCLGDSITAQGVYEHDLQQVLDAVYPGAKIHVVPHGIGGTRSDAGVGELADYLRDHQPTVVTVMFGVNDTGWNSADPEKKIIPYLDGLRKTIALARQHGMPVLLLKETTFSHNAVWSAGDAGIAECLDTMLAAEQRFAAENQVPLIDVYGAYRRGLSAAWTADPRYEITPDFVHPTSPGHAVIAGALLQALGAGLPLAEAERGPLHVANAGVVAVDTLDTTAITEQSVAKSPAAIHLPLRVRNLTGAPVSGELCCTVGTSVKRQAVSLPAWGSAVVAFSCMDTALPGRWDVLPLFAAFITPTSYDAAEAPLCYSRAAAIEKTPLAANGEDFALLQGPKRPCPVTALSVARQGKRIVVDFTWDDPHIVPAQPGAFKDLGGPDAATLALNLNSHDGQPCDAVEFLFDTRPPAALARCTSNWDSNPLGVARLGVFFDDQQRIALQTLPTLADGAATITALGDKRYRLQYSPPAQPLCGFNVFVTDVDTFGRNNTTRAYYRLTGKPGVVTEPASYLLLGTARPMLFYRLGY